MENNKMTTKKTFLLVIITALVTGIITSLSFTVLNKANDNNKQQTKIITSTDTNSVPIVRAAFSPDGTPADFSDAAEKTIHSVVHVNTVYKPKESQSSGDPFFDFFYGNRSPNPMPRQGSGSGVIISADGYIVTNNHVIDNATEVSVTFNDNKVLTAQVIGTDPNSDLAVIKVDATDLPAIAFGNSDNVRIGEWVLAVGNPFNLASTVTAGIVSAKSRNFGIIDKDFQIESFIQTDAAINPGNSGGALVNLRGELIGINTAIASRSGQYEGYGFAVPSSIVKKTTEDLIEHGTVQRALLGIRYSEVTPESAKDYGLKENKGVYIASVEDNSAAKDAGLKTGDVILAINGKNVTSRAIVQEEVGKSRPGDKMNLTINRDGETKHITATLRNKAGNYDTTLANVDIFTQLGATFKDVTPELRRKLGVSGGVQAEKISNGKLKEVEIKDGFIITHVNQRAVKSLDDFKRLLDGMDKNGGMLIAGIYPNGKKAYVGVGID